MMKLPCWVFDSCISRFLLKGSQEMESCFAYSFRANSKERQRGKQKLTHDDTSITQSEANLFWSSFELLLIFHPRSWSLSLSGTLVTHHDFVFFTDRKDSKFKETSLFNDMQRISREGCLVFRHIITHCLYKVYYGFQTTTTNKQVMVKNYGFFIVSLFEVLLLSKISLLIITPNPDFFMKLDDDEKEL